MAESFTLKPGTERQALVVTRIFKLVEVACQVAHLPSLVGSVAQE